MSKLKFTIGADPEFNFISPQSGRGEAQQTIRKFFPKNPAWEETNMGYKLKDKKVGSIGWDGASATGEIRPAPVSKPSDMVKNLGQLFTETAKTIPILEMSTLSFYASVGGHIHFSMPVEVKDKPGAITAIHKKLSSFYLPIMLSENKLSLQIRVRGNYGKITDHHRDNCFQDDKGKNVYTYEFRTPSAEWLTTPKIAEATVAYLACIYNEILYQPKNFRKCTDIVYKTDRQGEALQMLAMTEYETLSLLIFDKIKEYVKTFELYEEYKDLIDYILTPNQVLADKKAVQYNINKGWGLSQLTNKQITKKELLSEKAYKLKIKGLDMDTISPMTKMAFNADTNVDMFSKELSNKCGAFNWKLQHNYFFYGLRKGIDSFLVSSTNHDLLVGKEMIETIGDHLTIETLLSRMRERVSHHFSVGNNQQVDYGTGEVSTADKKNIMVGIPYALRIEKKTDSFLELIHDIETGKFKRISLGKLCDGIDMANHGGKIYDLFNPKEEPELPIEEQVNISNMNNERIRNISGQLEEDLRAEEVMESPINEVVVDESADIITVLAENIGSGGAPLSAEALSHAMDQATRYGSSITMQNGEMIRRSINQGYINSVTN